MSPSQPHPTQLRSVLIGVKSLLRALLPVLKSREMRDQIAARAWRLRARTSVLTVLLLIERILILCDPLRSETRGQSVSFVKERRTGGDCSGLASCQSWASFLTIVDQVGGGRLTPRPLARFFISVIILL